MALDLALSLVADACPWLRADAACLARLRCVCRVWRDAAPAQVEHAVTGVAALDRRGRFGFVCAALADPRSRVKALEVQVELQGGLGCLGDGDDDDNGPEMLRRGIEGNASLRSLTVTFMVMRAPALVVDPHGKPRGGVGRPSGVLNAVAEGLRGCEHAEVLDVMLDLRATGRLEWDEGDLGALAAILHARRPLRRVALLGGSVPGNEAVGWCVSSMASTVSGDCGGDEDSDSDDVVWATEAPREEAGEAAEAVEAAEAAGGVTATLERIEVEGLDADAARDVARLVRRGRRLAEVQLKGVGADSLTQVFEALPGGGVRYLRVDEVQGTLRADVAGLGGGVAGVENVACRRAPGIVSPMLHALASSASLSPPTAFTWRLRALDVSNSHGFDPWDADRRHESSAGDTDAARNSPRRLGDVLSVLLVARAAHLERVNLSSLLWPDARWHKRPKRGREPVTDMLVPILRAVVDTCCCPAPSGAPPVLRALDLSHNRFFAGSPSEHDSVAQEAGRLLGTILQSHASLSRLSLRGLDLGPRGACLLAAGLACNTALQWLDLGCTPLGTEGALALAEAVVPGPTGLRHLNLDRCGIDQSGVKALLPALLTFTDLVSLCLGESVRRPGDPTPGDPTRPDARPNKVRGLEVADFDGCYGASPPSLRSLELSGCRVTGQTIEALVRSACAATLRRLDLSDNTSLGRAGLDVLFHRMASRPTSACPRLAELDVSRCDLKGVVADAVARVLDADAGTLTCLNLAGNPVDRADAVAAAKARRALRGLPELLPLSPSQGDTWAF